MHTIEFQPFKDKNIPLAWIPQEIDPEPKFYMLTISWGVANTENKSEKQVSKARNKVEQMNISNVTKVDIALQELKALSPII